MTQNASKEPKDTYTRRIRDLDLGETLALSEPIPQDQTIAEVVAQTATMKRRGYWRFNKTVRRLHEQTGNDYRLATQLVWDDRLGLSLLTTITRIEDTEL